MNKYLTTGIITIATVIGLAGCDVIDTDTRVFSESFDRVEVDFGRADVTVQAQDGAASVTTDIKYNGERPSIDTQVVNGVLKVSLFCPTSATAETCDISSTIAVPAATEVKVGGFEGDIAIKDVDGNIEAKVDTGNVTATQILSEKFDAQIGTGDLQVNYRAESRDNWQVDVLFDVAVGDVSLEIPDLRH